jgi:hypothetical protein
LLKAPAKLKYLGIGWHGLQNLYYRGRGREQCNQPLQESGVRAIHEGMSPIAQDIESHKEGPVDGRAGGFVGITVKSIFQPIAEQQLVAKYPLLTIKDWLPRHIPQRL